jgi:hypothetical protein
MRITDDFKRIVDEDIKRCREASENGCKDDLRYLYHSLVSKYSPVIADFNGFFYSLSYDESGENTRKNIRIIEEKLLLFKAMGYENLDHNSEHNLVVNNTINNSVDITFDSVKSQIENMGALTQPEIDEVINKISQLENIVNSSTKRTQKWESAKGIIRWIADKGVDVGIALLPLLLQIK